MSADDPWLCMVEPINGREVNSLQGVVWYSELLRQPLKALDVLALLGRGILGGSVFLISFQEDLPPRA